MDLHIIDTGFFYADGGAMFGAIPKSAWGRRYPHNETNGCVLAMRSLLIKDGERIILVDNGAGNKHLKQLSYYHFFNLVDLSDELAKLGITPEQVTDVVLTHLHFDHCGYSTLAEEGNDKLRPAFPNATHWVSSQQWKNFLHPHPLEKDSFFIENMQAVADNRLLKLIDSDTIVYPHIELRLYDGHSPGQIVPYIYSEGQCYIFAGDVIPLAAHISPEWISAYDTQPLLSYQEKVRMLEEAAAKKHALIFCHDAYTVCATVKKINSFFSKDETIDLHHTP